MKKAEYYIEIPSPTGKMCLDVDRRQFQEYVQMLHLHYDVHIDLSHLQKGLKYFYQYFVQVPGDPLIERAGFIFSNYLLS